MFILFNLSLSSETVFCVKDRSKISLGCTFLCLIRYSTLPRILNVLPEPALAIIKLECSSVITAVRCCSSSFLPSMLSK